MSEEINEQIQKLQQRLIKLEEKIQEQKKRLPPHSIQPNLIAELDVLEEERDSVLKKIKDIKYKMSE